MKQSEKEMAFDERLHDMARSCRNVFCNGELVNCYKQGRPDTTRSLLENNLRGLPTSTLHDLDRVKLYALIAGTATRECQAHSVLTSTFSTLRQRKHSIHHIQDNLSIAYLPTSPPTLLSSLVPPTSHGVDQTKVPQLQVTDDGMSEILVQMENVVKIYNIGQALW